MSAALQRGAAVAAAPAERVPPHKSRRTALARLEPSSTRGEASRSPVPRVTPSSSPTSPAVSTRSGRRGSLLPDWSSDAGAVEPDADRRNGFDERGGARVAHPQPVVTPGGGPLSGGTSLHDVGPGEAEAGERESISQALGLRVSVGMPQASVDHLRRSFSAATTRAKSAGARRYDPSRSAGGAPEEAPILLEPRPRRSIGSSPSQERFMAQPVVLQRRGESPALRTPMGATRPRTAGAASAPGRVGASRRRARRDSSSTVGSRRRPPSRDGALSHTRLTAARQEARAAAPDLIAAFVDIHRRSESGAPPGEGMPLRRDGRPSNLPPTRARSAGPMGSRMDRGGASPSPESPDGGGQLWRPRSAMPLHVGPSIPETDTVVGRSSLPPSVSGETEAVYDPDSKTWVRQVFPNLGPSSRRDAKMLARWLSYREADLAATLKAQHGSVAPSTQEEARSMNFNPNGALRGGGYHGSDTSAVWGAMPDEGPHHVVVPVQSAAAEATEQEAVQQFDTQVERMRQSHVLYSAAFNEAVRQVSAHCVERGELLSRLWGRFLDTYDELAVLLSPLRGRVKELEALCAERAGQARVAAAARDRLHDENLRVQEELRGAREVEARARSALTESEAARESLRRELDVMQKVFQLDNVKDNLSVAKALVQSEESMEEIRNDMAEVQAEVDGLHREKDELIDEIGALHELVQTREQQLEEVVTEFDHAVADTKDGAQKSSQLRERLNVNLEIDVSQVATPTPTDGEEPDSPSALTKRSRATGGATARSGIAGGAHRGSMRLVVETIDVETQTEATDGDGVVSDHEVQSPSKGKGGGKRGKRRGRGRRRSLDGTGKTHRSDTSLESTASVATAASKLREGFSKYKGSVTPRGKKKKTVVPAFWRSFADSGKNDTHVAGSQGAWTLVKVRQLILDCYVEKLYGELTEGAKGVSLTPFVIQFLMAKYGLRKIVKLRVQELLYASRKFHRDLRVNWFARACHLFDPLEDDTSAFYMGALQVIMVDELHAQESGEKMFISGEDGRTWIPRHVAGIAARRGFPRGSPLRASVLDELAALPSLTLDDLGAKTRRQHEKSGAAKLGDKVDLDVFLDVMMRGWDAVCIEREAAWRSVFKECDEDLSDSLDFDEFRVAMKKVEGIEVADSSLRAEFVNILHDDGSDFVDENGFVKALRRMWAEQHKPFTEQQDPALPMLQRTLSAAISAGRLVQLRRGLRSKHADLEDLRSSFRDLTPELNKYIATAHQSPFIRLLLMSRRKKCEEVLTELDAHEKALEDDEEGLPSDGYHEKTRDAWSQFRALLSDVKQGLKMHRIRAARAIQRRWRLKKAKAKLVKAKSKLRSVLSLGSFRRAPSKELARSDTAALIAGAASAKAAKHGLPPGKAVAKHWSTHLAPVKEPLSPIPASASGAPAAAVRRFSDSDDPRAATPSAGAAGGAGRGAGGARTPSSARQFNPATDVLLTTRSGLSGATARTPTSDARSLDSARTPAPSPTALDSAEIGVRGSVIEVDEEVLSDGVE